MERLCAFDASMSLRNGGSAARAEILATLRQIPNQWVAVAYHDPVREVRERCRTGIGHFQTLGQVQSGSGGTHIADFRCCSLDC